MTIDFERLPTNYDALKPEQQKAVVAWAMKHIKNPESKFFGVPFSELCETMAANKNALRYLARGKDPFEIKPKRSSRIVSEDMNPTTLPKDAADAFIRTTLNGAMDTFLERIARGEIDVSNAGPKR